jgi:acyl-CoA thioesterase-1
VRKLIVYLGLVMSLGMAAPAAAQEVHVLAFGDSLTAGYGLPQGQGFAPQLEDALRRNGIPARVANAGYRAIRRARRGPGSNGRWTA